MHQSKMLQNFVLLALFAVSALCAPFEIPISRKSLLASSFASRKFNPEKWLQKAVQSVDNGQSALEMPKKGKCPFRDSALASNDNNDKNSEAGAISDFVDTFLVGEISVGTPAQKFNMILDSTMFVFYGLPATFLLDASTCSQGKQLPCEKMQLFNKSTSTTYKRILSYKDYTLAKDMISFGGVQSDAKFLLLDGKKFVGKNSFEIIYDSGALNLPRLDGIFSLAFTSSLAPISSGMEYLLKNSANKIATVYIEPLRELNFFAEQKGAITVGGLDTKRCAPDYHWTKVPFFAKRWQIPLKSVKYEIEGRGEITFKGGSAYFSTFHTFIYGPKDALQEILGLVKPLTEPIEGKMPKDVAIECDRSKLPNINFQFGEKTFTLTPEQYVLDVVLDPHDRSKNICHLMIRPTPNDQADIQALMGPNDWFFGQLFFNQHCVAFDYTAWGQRIGLSSHL